MFHSGGDVMPRPALSDWQWEILIDLVHERVLSVFQLRYLDAKIDTIDRKGYLELVEWFKEMPRIDDYRVRPGMYQRPQGGIYLVDDSRRACKLLAKPGGYEWYYSPRFIHEVDTLHRLNPADEAVVKARYPYPAGDRS